MAHVKLSTTLKSLTTTLGQMARFSAAAHQWAHVSMPKGMPQFTRSHLEMVAEIAFLQAFLAWESFLRETFILYLCGKCPCKGRAPKRYAHPPTRRIAQQLVVPDGRDYADWAKLHTVIGRAQRFFEDGRPYSQALKSQQSKLQDISTIRNAIAHASAYSWERFQTLVRHELGVYPEGLTIGGFLSMTMPNSSPPCSYLDFYLSVMRFVAEEIVPA